MSVLLLVSVYIEFDKNLKFETLGTIVKAGTVYLVSELFCRTSRMTKKNSRLIVIVSRFTIFLNYCNHSRYYKLLCSCTLFIFRQILTNN